jgi:hypothetical protein
LTEPETLQCLSCNAYFRKSKMVYLDEEDTQGYFPEGLYCSECAEGVRYEAFELEDEDLYDLEDD